MKNTLVKGIGASYVVTVELSQHDQDTLHQKALQSLQSEVKVPGFRPGHVPLHMVEKQIQPQYLKMAYMEEVVNASIKSILKEHEDKKFIGQPYDLSDEKKEDLLVLTYKLDTYPEVEVKNDGWKKLTVAAVDTAVTKDEITQALQNLAKQYADYSDAESIGPKTLVKAKYSMNDKDGNELHKGTGFFGEEEFTESPYLWKALDGKKKDDIVEIDYKEKELPHAAHYHPHGDETAKKIKTLTMVIVDTKDTIMPDFNDVATLEKLFQSTDIKSQDDLVKKIESVLIEQKEEQGLQKSIEDMLSDTKDTLVVAIPETIIREEMSARIKTLWDRMGGEEGLKQYFAKIGEQKTNEMYDDIKKSAEESLSKFFILRKLVELLEITDINRENGLDAEKKIYAKLVSSDVKVAKKAPAKKKSDEEVSEDTTEEIVAPKAKKDPAKKKAE
jgi:trigger factor